MKQKRKAMRYSILLICLVLILTCDLFFERGNQRIVSFIRTADFMQDRQVRTAFYQQYLFATTRGYELFIYDIYDPYNPKQVAAYTASERQEGSLDISFYNEYLFLSGTTLEILSVLSPESPVLLGTISGWSFKRVFIDETDSRLFAVDDGYFWVYDISEPDTPMLVSSASKQDLFPETPWQEPVQLEYRNNHVFLANSIGLHILNISPDSTITGTSFVGYEGCIDFCLIDDQVLLASPIKDLGAINISNITTPIVSSVRTDHDYCDGLELANDYLVYLLDRNLIIMSIDQSFSATDKHDEFHTADGDRVKDYRVRGDFVYLINGNGLKIFLISEFTSSAG